MSVRRKQLGFSVVEVVIVIVVAGVVGLLGYTFYNNYTSQANNKTVSDSQPKSNQPTTETSVLPAPAISNVSDLNSAETVLEQTDSDNNNDTDSVQLDKELESL